MEDTRLGVAKSMAEYKSLMLSNLDEVKLNGEKYTFDVQSDLENQLKDQKVRRFYHFHVFSHIRCVFYVL